jgi:DNA-binding MarR family transcriptional regulator
MPPSTRLPRPPLPAKASVEACSCDLTRRAARALSRLYGNALSEAGLTASQLGILREASLDLAPTFTTLAAAMVLDRTSLHRALAPMVRNGWLAVQDSSGRRPRLRTVSLTPAGRLVLVEGSRRWNRVQKKLTADFGESRWASLQSMMSELTEACLALDGKQLAG